MIRNCVRKLVAGRKNNLLLIMVLMVAFFSSSFKKENTCKGRADVPGNLTEDSLLSKQAFLKVYNVFISPRCMNCHPAGDIPLVGEDSHLHPQGVKRGKDGKGMYASKCSNCHLEINQPGLNMPPGDPNWHLPPANMKMVFQGKTPRELAAQLLDTSTNGNKTKEELVKHISGDGLVLAGWNPGEGRNPPPLSHAEFTKQFNLWINNGAYLPD
jgi:hypothetical protein